MSTSRTLLSLALARRIGCVLTLEDARAIAREVEPEMDRPIPVEQFAPLHWRGYTLQPERIAGQEDALLPLEVEFRREVGFLAPLHPGPHAARLRHDEAAGILLLLVARDAAGAIAGVMRIRVWPHSSTLTIRACDEMLYVLPAHRGWLGAQLARYAEACAFSLGARDFTLTCQDATDSGRLARFAGYRKVATIYKKVAQDACDYSQVPSRHRQGVAHEPLAPHRV